MQTSTTVTSAQDSLQQDARTALKHFDLNLLHQKGKEDQEEEAEEGPQEEVFQEAEVEEGDKHVILFS